MITQNRKANFLYTILDTYTAGIMLVGSEVKSVRNNDVSITESYVYFKDGELWIRNMRIARYKESTMQNHDELRDKKLLLTKHELEQIEKSMDKGVTIVPLEVLTLNNKIKVKIGIAKGKKQYDKRASIKEKDLDREMKRDQSGK